MRPLLRGLRATYNFFAGDAILLGAVAVAFALAFLLGRMPGTPAAVPPVVFVGIIVGGLAATLGREVAGRPRR
jgi:hypothetical protein